MFSEINPSAKKLQWEEPLEGKQKEIELEPIVEGSKVICPKCKGIKKKSHEYGLDIVCSKCGGKGKIDWIDEIMPEQEDF